MKKKLPARRPRRAAGRVRRPSPRHFPFRNLITAHSYSALGDESYGIIQRCVDETLRDPELREKIEFYAKKILKAIAAKL
jgi:hypothetical protein